MEDTRQYQCRVLEPSTIRLEKQSSFDFPFSWPPSNRQTQILELVDKYVEKGFSKARCKAVIRDLMSWRKTADIMFSELDVTNMIVIVLLKQEQKDIEMILSWL